MKSIVADCLDLFFLDKGRKQSKILLGIVNSPNDALVLFCTSIIRTTTAIDHSYRL